VVPCQKGSSFAFLELIMIGSSVGYVGSGALAAHVPSDLFEMALPAEDFSQQPLMADTKVSWELFYAPAALSAGALPIEGQAAELAFVTFQNKFQDEE
jgi:hypothetical protein